MASFGPLSFLLRPPVWRELGGFPVLSFCARPGGAPGQLSDNCARPRGAKEGKFSLKTLTSNLKRELRLPLPGQGHSRTQYHVTLALPGVKDSWTSVRGLNQKQKNKENVNPRSSWATRSEGESR